MCILLDRPTPSVNSAGGPTKSSEFRYLPGHLPRSGRYRILLPVRRPIDRPSSTGLPDRRSPLDTRRKRSSGPPRRVGPVATARQASRQPRRRRAEPHGAICAVCPPVARATHHSSLPPAVHVFHGGLAGIRNTPGIHCIPRRLKKAEYTEYTVQLVTGIKNLRH